MARIDPNLRIVCVGAGNMAEAIVRGMLEGEVCGPEQICMTDISAERVSFVRQELGVRGQSDNRAAVSGADVVLLAVKPQVLPQVLSDMREAVPASALVISIAAGVSIATLRAGLRDEQRIIRVMPNTPCLVRQGVSAMAAGERVTEDDLALTETCLAATGLVLRVEESDLDAVTAVSGSGPAYYFYVVEAMLQAAAELGLRDSLARSLCYGTIRGAAAMLEETSDEPSDLRARVTSKGGTTEAAIRSLDDDAVQAAIRKAVQAAYRRSRELSQG